MKKTSLVLLLIATMLITILSACGESKKTTAPVEPVTPVESAQTDIAELPATTADVDTSVPEAVPEAVEEEPVTVTEDQSEPEADTTAEAPAAEPASDKIDEFGYIKKYQAASEENGIYALIVEFNDTVPAAAELKYLFYNDETGSEEIVCTYTAQYERTDGLYDSKCFYDGNIDVNYHAKTELKIPVTFGATVRAKRAELYIIENDVDTKLLDVYADR